MTGVKRPVRIRVVTRVADLSDCTQSATAPRLGAGDQDDVTSAARAARPCASFRWHEDEPDFSLGDYGEHRSVIDKAGASLWRLKQLGRSLLLLRDVNL
jgi:hypothetical protein